MKDYRGRIKRIQATQARQYGTMPPVDSVGFEALVIRCTVHNGNAAGLTLTERAAVLALNPESWRGCGRFDWWNGHDYADDIKAAQKIIQERKNKNEYFQY